MKKTSRAFAMLTTAAVLTGTCSISAAAALQPEENAPLAETLYQFQQQENIMWKPTYLGRYGYDFLSAEGYVVYNLLELSYEIQVEPGTVLPDDLNQQLLATLRKMPRYQYYEDKRVVCDTEQDENGHTNPISFVQKDETTYLFRIDPFYFLTDDQAVASFWQTVPGFVSIQMNAVGYDLTETDTLNTYSKSNNAFRFNDQEEGIYLSMTGENDTLTLEDLPAGLPIELNTYQGTTYDYVIQPEGNAKTISCENVYQILNALQSMDNVDYSMHYAIIDLAIDTEKYKIDNGAITLAARGDCNRDDKVDIYDAYNALISSSTEALGEASALGSREYLAADVDGDGRVSINDAYRILLYSSGQYLGTGSSWTELLS